MNRQEDRFEALAPEVFWVLVIDNYHGPDEDASWMVGPFDTWEHAVEYARRRTRDSVEECRAVGDDAATVCSRFLMFGESCSVQGRAGTHYSARDEIDHFVCQPASNQERDWGALAPQLASSPGKNGLTH